MKQICSQMQEHHIRSLKHEQQPLHCSASAWDPHTQLRLFWDVLTLLFILISLVLLPLEVSFDYFEPDMLIQVDLIVNAFFMLDILVIFNTGFYREVAIEYLKLWFWIDCISSLPYDMLNYTSFKPLSFFRVLKFLKVIRVLRAAKLKQIFRKIQEITNETLYRILEFIRLCGIIILIVHWCSCLFNYVTDGQYGYLDCFYFSITTMITVGYGDIEPKTIESRIYVVFAMILANGVFGYALNSMVSILSRSASSEEQAMLNRHNLVYQYMKQHRCSYDLKIRVSGYLEWMYSHEKIARQQTMMQDLSYELYKDVSRQVMQNKMLRLPIKINLDIIAMKETILLQDQELKDPETLFYIQSGKIGIYDVNNFISESDKWVGELNFYANVPRTAKMVTRSICSIIRINRMDFIQSLDDERFQLFHEIKINIELRQDIRKLNLKCYGCDSDDHVVKYCPKLHYITKQYSPPITVTYYQRRPRKFRTNFNQKQNDYFQFLYEKNQKYKQKIIIHNNRKNIDYQIDQCHNFDNYFRDWNPELVIQQYNYKMYLKYKEQVKLDTMTHLQQLLDEDKSISFVDFFIY